ncbi:TPA: hypothetical protein ACGORA_000370 [Streptococcus suis]
MGIDNHLKVIKEGVFGRDVRQAIHDGIEQAYDDATANGNANMEVAKARGVYDTLPNRLQAIDGMLISKLNSLTNISPKDVVESFDALVSTHPAGSDGVFITADTGHWYFWNGSNWEDGGAYQSPMPADFVKSTYLSRVSRNTKKVQSDLNLLLFSVNGVSRMRNTTIDAESITVSSDGYCFPVINLASASDIYLTFHNPNHPERIKIAIKLDNTILKSFDLKGSSIDGTYYADLNEYLSETSNPSAYIEIRIDNRGMSDNLTIEKFLVGKGGIPVSASDSLIEEDVDILSRLVTANIVKSNTDLLYKTNTELATISGSSIDISPGGYYFPVIKVGSMADVYVTFSGLNYPKRVSARIKRGLESIVPSIKLKGSVADGIYYFNLNDYLNLDALPDDVFEIRIDNRDMSDNLTIEKFLVGKGGIPTDLFDAQTKKEVYVDATASIKGDGTIGSPFKTIQEALDVRAETILVAPGIYNESLTATNYENLIIRSLTESDYNISTKTDIKSVTISQTTKLITSEDDTILSSTITAGTSSRLYKTFISKTLPLIEAGTRSDGYNVTVWESIGNIATEKRLVPVATQSECKAQTGTFTFDGTKIWINPFDGISENKEYLILNDAENCANFSNIQHLSLSGLKFIGGYNNTIRMNKIIKFDFVRVEASRSALRNGFSCDNSNGTFTSCIANQNRNDGFNFHSFGDTHLIDCEGHYNFDDGNSHHDGCTGTIVRGEWSHNGKGGCSPTYGSIVHIDGAYSHHNQYGFYCENIAENPIRTVRHSNCVAKDNASADYLIGTRYTVLGMSNSYTTKTGGGAYVQLK